MSGRGNAAFCDHRRSRVPYARGVGRLALAFWFASALSLIAAQIQARRLPPASETNPAQQVVEACRPLLSPESTLGIAYSAANDAHVFVAYRLAYEAYPKVIT